MASRGPEFCEYCGLAPCVGDRCPQWADDEEWGACAFCARPLSPADPDDLCASCRGDHDEDDEG